MCILYANTTVQVLQGLWQFNHFDILMYSVSYVLSVVLSSEYHGACLIFTLESTASSAQLLIYIFVAFGVIAGVVAIMAVLLVVLLILFIRSRKGIQFHNYFDERTGPLIVL